MIKMIIKGRSPHMRHVSRTHLDWLFERDNWDPNISVSFAHANQQIADILTTQSDFKGQESPGIGRPTAFPRFQQESRSHRHRNVRYGRLLLDAHCHHRVTDCSQKKMRTQQVCCLSGVKLDDGG